MKRLLVMLLVLISTNAFAFNPLSNFSEDERLHGLVSFGLTEITKHHFNFEWWQSLLFIGGVGLIKETLDNQYDPKDINANFGGCFLSLSLDFISSK